jgi:hypothetical protein
MGRAIIADAAEGWVVSYDAAAAKAVGCSVCDDIDGGTPVGYENYPMEVYLPFALADGFPTAGGDLQNRLSLWAPALLPGASIANTDFIVNVRWWDGRERSFVRDRKAHSLNEPLSSLDIRFDVANFVCGHTSDPDVAENDGFPRIARLGGGALGCDGPEAPDPVDKSDNFEDSGDLNVTGHQIQPSTPMGWWRFNLVSDTAPPPLNGPNSVRSGRGLVGVVLSSTSGSRTIDNLTSGMGYATRLWHEDSCEIAQSGGTIGPPHKGHGQLSDENVALFNTFSLQRQKILCGLIRRVPFPFDFPGDTFEPPQ